MRFFGVCAAIVLMASLWRAEGQTADDRYISIYTLIDDADRLNASGETKAAVNKYQEAQTAIKELQRLYPNWNERVAAYRLDYITTKLEPLVRGKGETIPSPKGASNSTSRSTGSQ